MMVINLIFFYVILKIGSNSIYLAKLIGLMVVIGLQGLQLVVGYVCR